MLTADFDDLYQRHFTEIYRHCYRTVQNKENAEELSNETFVKAYFQRAWFDEKMGKIRNWIFTIATNLCLDFIKSADHRKQLQTHYLDELIFIKSNSLTPDENSERAEILKFIEDCFSELIEAERKAVSSRHLQGFKLQEIAEILGMSSPNSTKNRIKTGEKKLKRCLENKGIDDNYLHDD